MKSSCRSFTVSFKDMVRYVGGNCVPLMPMNRRLPGHGADGRAAIAGDEATPELAIESFGRGDESGRHD